MLYDSDPVLSGRRTLLNFDLLFVCKRTVVRATYRQIMGACFMTGLLNMVTLWFVLEC